MIIELLQLSKQYEDNKVLDIPALSIHEGELVGLVGNNGAGKTTMLRLILDLVKASSGYVTINGRKVNEDSSWKLFTGSFLDSSFLIEFYTPEEFFGFIAEAYSIPKQELETRLQQYDVLMRDEILGKHKLIHDFSNGNRQKIGIIGAMIINPKILILDEPFNFLDPTSQTIVAEKIKAMNYEYGTTSIISSHNICSINEICSRILLLDKGRVAMNSSHKPGANETWLQAYFTDIKRSVQ